LGGEVREAADRKVVWQASQWDRKAHPQLPEGASLAGRVIVCRNPSRPEELLYLFTTLDLCPEEIVGIYKLRWNVETDLRSLKRTVGLHQLNSKSVDMVEKNCCWRWRPTIWCAPSCAWRRGAPTSHHASSVFRLCRQLWKRHCPD